MITTQPYSPLRYPGGKTSITRFIADLASVNDLNGGTYIELYAGGAGAALNLLFNDVFDQIHINDFDYRIYSMWYSILNQTEEFIELVRKTPVTIEEWHIQKKQYEKGRNLDSLNLGFATFFLNRTNRSGIIFKAGPIGGLKQKGNYLIDARYNKDGLISRIEKISNYKNKITLTNLDAIQVIDELNNFYADNDNTFFYLDPPYYNKGQKLYLNNYNHYDHSQLSRKINLLDNTVNWLISYDNVSEIRTLYENFRLSSFDLNYSLQEKRLGSELFIFSNNLQLVDDIKIYNRQTELKLINPQ